MSIPTSAYDDDALGGSGMGMGVEVEDGLIDLNLSHGSSPLSGAAYDDDAPMLGQFSQSVGQAVGKQVADQAAAQVSQQTQAVSNAKCWSIDYYKPYFDVDTKTELSRLKRSIWPFLGTVYNSEDQSGSVDLYGPFWIVSTLAFLMAAMSNFSRFISRQHTDAAEWNSDITTSASFLYGALIIVPGVAYGLMRYQSVDFPFLKLLSLYGYSLVAFVPATVFCVAPIEILQWISIILCLLLNAKFLYLNIYQQLPEDKVGKPGLHLLIWFGACQIISAVVLKSYFLQY